MVFFEAAGPSLGHPIIQHDIFLSLNTSSKYNNDAPLNSPNSNALISNHVNDF